MGKLEKFWSLLSKLASQFDLTSRVGAVPILRKRSSLSSIGICLVTSWMITVCNLVSVFRCKHNPLVDACGIGEENLVAAILAHDSSALNKADQVGCGWENLVEAYMQLLAIF